MSVGFVFWVLMLIWLVFGVFWSWPAGFSRDNLPVWGGSALMYILFFLLGWHVFGWPIHG